MKTTNLPRRTLLRSLGTGVGGALIGLPLLEEMIAPAAMAKPASIPVRAFNVFFGLGIPTPLQGEGFDDVLEPLKPLQNKLSILRGVDHVRCDQSGINGHFDGSAAAFTAAPPDGEAKSGGASLDQIIRHGCYPDGLPPELVPTLSAGTFFRRSRICRYAHTYNLDGTVAARMQEKPRDLFDRVFGTIASLDPADREQRLKRSVLDSVVDQYRFYTGSRSPLGAASRARVADHLDRVREFELRAYTLKDKAGSGPSLPPRSKVLHGSAADPNGQGIDISLNELVTEWRLLADLYALAIELDRVRFGAITFLAAGERIRLTGDYEFNGEKRYTFDDARQLNAAGDKGCSHEWWHKFNEKNTNEALRAHAHMKMREVAYFLARLDETKEINGKSILENSLITISTESGDGRHNNVKRELSGVFHAVTGANGRFKTGGIIDVNAEGLDVYNTLINGMGAKGRLGPADRKSLTVESILA